MSVASVSTNNHVSPWQSLQDGGDSSQSGSASTSPAFNDPSFWPPPPGPAGDQSDTRTADSGMAGSTSAAGGASQLAAGLQSFLVNLQSAASTDSTAATDTSATAAATSGTTTAGTTTVDATSSGSNSPITAADLFGDLNALLAELESTGSTASATQDPTATATATTDGTAATASSSTDGSTTANSATDVSQTNDPDGPHHPHGPHHLAADILSAVQSYASQATPAATATTTIDA